MTSRRKFLQKSLSSGVALSLAPILTTCSSEAAPAQSKTEGITPIVLSTWDNRKANQAAWAVLKNNGSALDAVEQGVRVPEADPADRSVGYGGRPDRDGKVTLDACIMDEKGNCGSVCFLQNIMHPISVARKVMEETPHVILAGEGALQFALQQGFQQENLLTEESKVEWEQWLVDAKYEPVINIERHDTIGMLAIDHQGHISGACTTSGMGFKMHGRVGDSPIIGAGLFVDNEVGGAVATGVGEAVLKTLGSFLVVELMRQGRNPQEACEEAVARIANKYSDYKDIQVGFLALNKQGQIGAHAIQAGFLYAVTTAERHEAVDATSLLPQ